MESSLLILENKKTMNASTTGAAPGNTKGSIQHSMLLLWRVDRCTRMTKDDSDKFTSLDAQARFRARVHAREDSSHMTHRPHSREPCDFFPKISCRRFQWRLSKTLLEQTGRARDRFLEVAVRCTGALAMSLWQMAGKCRCWCLAHCRHSCTA